MTLDKFGRHLMKRYRQYSDDDDDHNNSNKKSEILTSAIRLNNMYYNLILDFRSTVINEQNKYVLQSGKSDYSFPLKNAVIEQVRSVVADNEFIVNINDKMVSKEELINFPLKLNDTISFVASDKTSPRKSIFAYVTFYVEIVIKCPILFEKSPVTSGEASSTV